MSLSPHLGLSFEIESKLIDINEIREELKEEGLEIGESKSLSISKTKINIKFSDKIIKGVIDGIPSIFDLIILIVKKIFNYLKTKLFNPPVLSLDRDNHSFPIMEGDEEKMIKKLKEK